MKPLALLPAVLCCVGALYSQIAVSAKPLPVEVGQLQGEVAVIQDRGGEGLYPGTRILTGRDGSAELRMGRRPSLWLGPNAELLLHSAEGRALRARLVKGSLHVDTRAGSGVSRRDLRLNAGDMRLQILGGELWLDQSDEETQVCSIAGEAELQLDGRHDRLDFPGQCVRRTGPETAWTLVPLEVLATRTAALTGGDVVAGGAPPVQAAKPAATASIEPAAAPAEPLPVAPVAEALAVPILASLDLPEIPPAPAVVPSATAEASTEPAVAAAAASTAPTTGLDPTLSETLARAENIAARRASSAVEESPVPTLTAPVDARGETAATSVSAPPGEDAEIEADAAAVEAQLAPPAPVADPGPPADDGRRWSVVLASMSTLEAATAEVERLGGFGIQTEARLYQVGERVGYRVGMGRFESREQADAALEALQQQRRGIPGWVAKY